MKPESKFWGQIREGMMTSVDWLRLENLVTAGPPDVNGCLDGREVWIELKIMTNGRVTLRHSQYLWFYNRVFKAKATNVFLVARSEKCIVAWEGLEFFKRARCSRFCEPERKKAWRIRVDENSMTFDPGIPQFSARLGDPGRWIALGEFVFGSLYTTVLMRNASRGALHDKVEEEQG